MKVSALVTSTRKAAANEYILSTVTAGGRLIVISREYAAPGAYIEVYGTKVVKDIPEITAERIKVLKDGEAKKVIADIDRFIDKNCRIGARLLVKDKILNSLTPQFEDAARRLKKAVFLHRPIIVRFHNDTDGLCSALALYFAMAGARNTKFLMNTFPYYRALECEADIESLQHLDAEYLSPIFVACDFGANEESLDQYRKLKKEGFEIIIVDHHPPHPDVEAFVDCFVSPFLVGGDSNHVTGLLAVEVAYLIAQIETNDLHSIALTGDRSRLSWFNPSQENKRKALALEYMLQTSRQKYTIDEMAKTLLDKEFMDILYTQATDKLGEVSMRLKAKVKKRQFGDVTVFMFSTDTEFKEGEFPGRGDMASLISDELGEKLGKPAVTIGHGEHSINMRLNTEATRAGLNLGVFISAVKGALPHAIEAGGGHAGAASIRAKKGHAKAILAQLLKEIEKAAGKATGHPAVRTSYK